jgi:hypothetical protein
VEVQVEVDVVTAGVRDGVVERPETVLLAERLLPLAGDELVLDVEPAPPR